MIFNEMSQNVYLTTSEICLAPNVRYKLPCERIESGARVRAGFLWVPKREPKEWTNTNRQRPGNFTDIPISVKRRSEYNILFISSFMEFFFQTGEDDQERYAKLLVSGLALGYHSNQRLRFESIQYRQDSENASTTGFEDFTKANILLFAKQHNLNKAKK